MLSVSSVPLSLALAFKWLFREDGSFKKEGGGGRGRESEASQERSGNAQSQSILFMICEWHL